MVKYTVDLFERKGCHLLEHIIQFHVVSEEIDFLGFDSLYEYIMDKSRLYIDDSLNVFYTVQQSIIDYNV
nr:hypothetical protein MOLUWOTD_MOLUWOTD_CDS_0006 [Microvirus sp.]